MVPTANNSRLHQSSLTVPRRTGVRQYWYDKKTIRHRIVFKFLYIQGYDALMGPDVNIQIASIRQLDAKNVVS